MTTADRHFPAGHMALAEARAAFHALVMTTDGLVSAVPVSGATDFLELHVEDAP